MIMTDAVCDGACANNIYRLKPFVVVEQLVASVFTWRTSTSFISAEVLQLNMGFLTRRKLRKESPQQITWLVRAQVFIMI